MSVQTYAIGTAAILLVAAIGFAIVLRGEIEPDMTDGITIDIDDIASGTYMMELLEADGQDIVPHKIRPSYKVVLEVEPGGEAVGVLAHGKKVVSSFHLGGKTQRERTHKFVGFQDWQLVDTILLKGDGHVAVFYNGRPFNWE